MDESNTSNNTPVHLFKDIALLSTLLIFLGAIKMYLFYGAFNIPISMFFSVSSFGLFVSENLLHFFVLMLFARYFLFISKTDKLKPIVEKKIQAYFGLLLVSCLIFINIRFYFFVNNDYIEKLKYYGWIILIIFFLLLTNNQKRFYLLFKSYYYFLLIYYTTLSISYIFLNTAKELESIQNGKFSGTKITTADSTISITDSLLFVGKTDNHLFLYNLSDSSSIIIPSQDVKSIVLKLK